MMRPTSPVPVFIGIGTTLVGFLAIVIAWTRVAGAASVAEQLPAVVGGGLVGIGLILAGLTVVAVQSRRIEGSEQVRQIAQVAASVSAFREILAPTDDDRMSVSAPASTDEA